MGLQAASESSAWVSGSPGGTSRLEAELGHGGPGAWGCPERSSSGKPPAGTGVGAATGEQGSSGAPCGRFPTPVSLKNPQNPTGGVCVWAAVTLKGFCNRSLEEAAQPPPGSQWLKGQDGRNQPPHPDTPRTHLTPHLAPILLMWKLRPKNEQRSPPQDLPGKFPQLRPGGHSPGPQYLRQTSLHLCATISWPTRH